MASQRGVPLDGDVAALRAAIVDMDTEARVANEVADVLEGKLRVVKACFQLTFVKRQHLQAALDRALASECSCPGGRAEGAPAAVAPSSDEPSHGAAPGLSPPTHEESAEATAAAVIATFDVGGPYFDGPFAHPRSVWATIRR